MIYIYIYEAESEIERVTRVHETNAKVTLLEYQ